jgi:hypothetical protein
MPKHYADDDALDERGLLRDGRRIRVPMQAMDSLSLSVRQHFADASVIFGDGTDPLGRHKPGLRRTSDQAALDAKAQAFADSVAELTDAWRKPVEDKRKKTQRRDPQGREEGSWETEEEDSETPPRTMDAATAQRIRDEAWKEMVDEMQSAWKGPAR